ncbi:hypothetical protein [Streptomyces sp. AMCC400023]|uniref:hypothetical protein n=1 Tax=Streptomyces sp. AMCC400023 TaxID=2056258 RepID=UPI001F2C83FC|nr:hypothetical protein [Streptomyces sp. AMCC400023]UJV42089.1 hypothetical protein CVT30_21545 [Streptomyces sp. AMCC400023]
MKQSGLGDGLIVDGTDLSGDTGSLGRIGGGPAALEITGIDKSAFERIGGLRDGGIDWSSWFNPAAAKAHAKLSTLPITNRMITYQRGTSLGKPAACLIGKQIDYAPSRGDDGAMTIAVQSQSNGYGIEWGEQVTPGIRTDTGAANGTGVEFGYDGEDYLALPGASGDYASTPDAAALDITGDIDLRVRVALNDWTPAAESTLIAKYTATGNQRSYALAVTTAGALIFRWSEDGTVEKTETSSANLGGLTAGATTWVRATLDADVGGTDAQVTFYTSEDGSTWTQLGAVQAVGAVTSIFASTAVLELGGQTLGTVNRLAGKVFRAQVLSGIGGTSVAAPIASASSNSVTDATPRTWTVNGAAYLSSRTRYGLQAYLQVLSFTGTDVTIKLQSSSDNGSTDAYADVTGGGFTQVTSGPTSERIATSSALEIERYLRVVTTTSGGFSELSFVVVVAVNLTETEF